RCSYWRQVRDDGTAEDRRNDLPHSADLSAELQNRLAAIDAGAALLDVGVQEVKAPLAVDCSVSANAGDGQNAVNFITDHTIIAPHCELYSIHAVVECPFCLLGAVLARQ